MGVNVARICPCLRKNGPCTRLPPTGCLPVAFMAQGAQRRSCEGLATPCIGMGKETLDAKRGRVKAMSRIRVLADLGVAGGFLQRRIPDRLVCHRELLLLQR